MANSILGPDPTNWGRSKLGKILEQNQSPETDAVRATLKLCMPNIEKVLSAGDTSPLNFTLHDPGHAFRVAERMAQLIPEDVLTRISAYELALLLLSAYLHDIGMTPERRKVQQHRNYIATGERQDLSEGEVREFQKWCDDQDLELTIPLCAGQPTTHELNRVDELVMHYCRYRHNDWSEEWIRDNLRGQLATYVDWVGDLVALCRSHHQRYHDLMRERFNPRYVGSPARVVHLRYLACMLRVADVLEIDPERTPEVIMRHRDVAPPSFIFWWKDHYVSIKKEGDRFLISARPPSAQIHRAIEVTADQIDEELQLCRRLADETHFEKYPGPATTDLPHRWTLQADVHRDIAPKDDAYEYINGAFRPNTEKLLSLLSGRELYGSPLVAIRELLQNAFDAVREQIAYERLGQTNPSDPMHEVALGKQHHVRLRIEAAADGMWITCADSGVGMNKAIIRDHLLVSGTPRRHDILELERRCREAGFALGRTGEFGIGVLTYFMLAHRVVIQTRRGQGCGDEEEHGWIFETEGIGSFGELRKIFEVPRGTQVHLHIRTGVLDENPHELTRLVTKYVKDVLVRTPCNFELSSDEPGSEKLVLPPGWVRATEDFSALLVQSVGEEERSDTSTPLEILSAARRRQHEAQEQLFEKVRSEMSHCLHWDVDEGSVPGGLGFYRIHLPYFTLPRGASLAFLRPREADSELLVEPIDEDAICLGPRSGISVGFSTGKVFGWKGMRVYFGVRDAMDGGELRYSNKACVEIDWTTGRSGSIRVDRMAFTPTGEAKRALMWLDGRAREIHSQFLAKHKNSEYATLNCRIAGLGIPIKRRLAWLAVESERDQKKFTWRRLTFPLVNGKTLPTADPGQIKSVQWRGRDIYVAPPMAAGKYQDLCWNGPSLPPDKVIVCPSYTLQVLPLWSSSRNRAERRHPFGPTCQFPPNWNRLSGIEFDKHSGLGYHSTVWNRAHPLARAITAEGWAWCKARSLLDPLPHKVHLLSDKGRAAAWVMKCLTEVAYELWDGLKDRDPSFLPELLRLLFGSHSRVDEPSAHVVCQWVEASDSRLRVLSPDGWHVYKSYEDGGLVQRYIPDPGPDWRLVITTNQRQNQRSLRRAVLASRRKLHWWHALR